MCRDPAVTGAASKGSLAFADLISAIGIEGALALARKHGGTAIYIPSKASAGAKLRASIGDELVAKLMAFGAGSRLLVPKRPARHFRVWKLHVERALTIAEIAVETGYSERQVYRILSQPFELAASTGSPASDDCQLDLFEK